MKKLTLKARFLCQLSCISVLLACQSKQVDTPDVTSPTEKTSTSQVPSGQTLQRIPLKISHGIATTELEAEVAQTPEQLMTGLMHRQHLPDNQGMLFVFDAPNRQCFWMKNTHIPLSIAFLDAKGTIVSLQDMQPLSLKEHCADNSQFTLEMNQGWFAKHHVKVGDRVLGIEQWLR